MINHYQSRSVVSEISKQNLFHDKFFRYPDVRNNAHQRNFQNFGLTNTNDITR